MAPDAVRPRLAGLPSAGAEPPTPCPPVTVLALLLAATAFVLFLVASFTTPASDRARAQLVPLGLAAATAAGIVQLLGLTPPVA